MCAVKHVKRIYRGLNEADIKLRCHLTGSSHDLLFISCPEPKGTALLDIQTQVTVSNIQKHESNFTKNRFNL